MCKKCKRTLEEPQALGAFHVSGAFDALVAARASGAARTVGCGPNRRGWRNPQPRL